MNSTIDNTPKKKQPPSLPPGLAQNVALVHRVMLADPSEFESMTLSGNPRRLETPSFQDFAGALDGDSSASTTEQMASTMKRAFRDRIVEKLQQQDDEDDRSNAPANELLLELHGELRALIPARQDLHGLLQDDAVKDTTSISDLLPRVVQAAQALSMLESEARAESTLAWIGLARQQEQENDTTTFVVNSLLYLLFKAELCALDKQDFYFAHMWAPQLAHEGPSIERAAFEANFGPLKKEETAPHTRQWMREIFQNQQQSSRSDETCQRLRQNQIRQAWVHRMLFRGPNEEPMELPEIFYLDQMRFNGIRLMVKMAVSGSALALHACQFAGLQPTNVLSQTIEPSSPLDLRRTALVQAMGERLKTEQQYRQDIGAAVVALARHWNPNLSTTTEELHSRALRVLDGDDPVITLLNERMKGCFAELMTMPTEATAPTELRSGRSAAPATTRSRKAAFLEKATSLFCAKGLAFYASDLALAAWSALRIIEVALLLYHDVLLA